MLVTSDSASSPTPRTPRREPVSAVNTDGLDPVELELNAHLLKEAAQYVNTGHLMYKPGMRPYGARPRSSSPRAAPGTPRVPAYLKGRVSESPRLQKLVDEIKRGESAEPEHVDMKAIEPKSTDLSSPTRKLEVAEEEVSTTAPTDTALTTEPPSLPALQAVLRAYEATLAQDGIADRDRYSGLAIIATSANTPRKADEPPLEPQYGRVGAPIDEYTSTAQRSGARVAAQEDELRARRTRMEELLEEQKGVTEKPKSEYELFLEGYNRSRVSRDSQLEADARKMELTERLIREEEEALAAERARPATPRASRPILTLERKSEMEARLKEMAAEKEELLDEEEEWRDSHDAVLRVRAKFEEEKYKELGGVPPATLAIQPKQSEPSAAPAPQEDDEGEL